MFLQSAPPAALQECLRVLEIVVLRNYRSGNFTGLNWPPIQRGDDSDHVGLDLMQPQLRCGHTVVLAIRRRNHREQGDVDAVNTGSKHAQLPAFLAAVGQELARVLEIVALDDFAQDSPRGNRRAIRSDDSAVFWSCWRSAVTRFTISRA